MNKCGGIKMTTLRSFEINRTLSWSSISGVLVLSIAIGCGPTYPNCDDDSDCKQAEYCVNGTCQQCRGDNDCAEGQQCTAGRCEDIQGYCTTDGDCGVDEECRANRCQPKPPEVPDAEPEPVAQACSIEPVYFDFDSSTLGEGSRQQLISNAQCMREKSIKEINLTGLTDPRGTEEYNMALGDRRAKATKQYLQSLGSDATINYTSMGEEMARGTDESSWARDRRVDFDKR